MKRRRDTGTEYLNLEKAYSAIKTKIFKRKIHNTEKLYKFEPVKPEIEHRGPIIVGFFFFCSINELWKILVMTMDNMLQSSRSRCNFDQQRFSYNLT